MKIYVLGNGFLKEDNLALRVMKSLKGSFEFNQVNTLEQIEFREEFVIVDVVKNLHKVKLFNSLEEFEQVSSITTHDLDVAFFLNLLKDMGNIDKIRIIGVPQKGNISKIKSDVLELLQDCSVE